LLHALELIGEVRILGSVRLKLGEPHLPKLPAPLTNAGPEMLAHAIRHEEFGVFGPAVTALGEADLLLAEGFAMRGAGVVLVRGAVADMAVDDYQGRHILGAPEILDCQRQLFRIIRIAHLPYVPTVSKEARADIVAEGE